MFLVKSSEEKLIWQKNILKNSKKLLCHPWKYVFPFYIIRKFQLHLRPQTNTHNTHIRFSLTVCPQLCLASSHLRLISPGSHKDIWHSVDSPLGSNNHPSIALALLSRSNTGESNQCKKKECSIFLLVQIQKAEKMLESTWLVLVTSCRPRLVKWCE